MKRKWARPISAPAPPARQARVSTAWRLASSGQPQQPRLVSSQRLAIADNVKKDSDQQ